MNGSQAAINEPFAHDWRVEILPARPLILPRRHFTYPREAQEVERGALELLIDPGEGMETFLASCALGFADPMVPSGVWSAPNLKEICAVSGGYAYLIDTATPQRFSMIAYRPVLEVRAALELLLFIGHRGIFAWGKGGRAWESPKLSDEGLTISAIEGETLHGLGWGMMTDKETRFALDLKTGLRVE